jgi:hypothetical protein
MVAGIASFPSFWVERYENVDINVILVTRANIE